MIVTTKKVRARILLGQTRRFLKLYSRQIIAFSTATPTAEVPFKLTHCYLKAQIPRTTMSLARVASSKAPLVAARMAAKRPIPSSSMAAIGTPLSTSANMALDNLKGVLEEYRQVQ